MLVGVGVWFVSDLIERVLRLDRIPVGLAATARRRAPIRRVMRLRSGLAYGQRDDAALERLRARLVELVDDQLLAVHQIDRADDPDAARTVLGDELYAFVDRHRRRPAGWRSPGRSTTS